MELKQYLHELPRGEMSKLAARLGFSTSYLSQLAAGDVNRNPKICSRIELETGRMVTRRELRPDDWHEIWPELVTQEHPAPRKRAA